MKRAANTVALVIDDNASICRLVGTILESEGVQVLLAYSADEGLNLVRNNAVDVLFTDLRLPGEDGVSVIRKSLQLRPQLAAVVFTGAATIESSVEAMRLGACDYVTKPIDRRKIVIALSRALSLRDLKKTTEQHSDPRNLGDSGDLASVQRTTERPPRVNLVAASAPMREVVSLASRVASLDFPVLIRGETGVGKKLLARSIHCQSARAGEPFLHVACAALRDAPPQSELFGSQQAGTPQNQTWSHFTAPPDGSTLFLEDVDELPLWAQVQLLDVVEGSWLPTPWSSTPKLGDVRVIASTAADLEAAVSAGQFHRRLYDHLNLTPIKVPPLRERREDVKPLAIYFLEQFRRSQNGNGVQHQGQLSREVWDLLHHYHWPGNVRELAIVLARLALLGERAAIDGVVREQLQTAQQSEEGETISVPLAGDLKVMERHLIREVVRRHGGNKAAAARALGMHRRTLYRVLENGKPNRKSDADLRQPVGSPR